MKTITRKPGNIKEIEFYDPLVISFVGEFSEEAMKEQLETIINLGEEKVGVLPVLIDSFGGDAFALNGIIDLWEQSGNLILTSAVSKAFSSGALLLAFGTPGMRFISPRCSYMLHDLSAGVSGKLDEMTAATKSIENMREQIFVEFARACGQPDNFAFDLLGNSRNSDVYLTPQQVVDYGIADHIGIPTIAQDITYEYSVRGPKGEIVYSNVFDYTGANPIDLSEKFSRNNPPLNLYPERNMEEEEEIEMRNMLSQMSEPQIEELTRLAEEERERREYFRKNRHVCDSDCDHDEE
jgi:ATP-dependent Clp protease protease subunit